MSDEISPPNAGPYYVGPAIRCTICNREIRMYGSQFSNADDGELHTCATVQFAGPRIVEGDFFYIERRSPLPERDRHA